VLGLGLGVWVGGTVGLWVGFLIASCQSLSVKQQTPASHQQSTLRTNARSSTAQTPTHAATTPQALAGMLVEVCKNPRSPGFNHYLFEVRPPVLPLILGARSSSDRARCRSHWGRAPVVIVHARAPGTTLHATKPPPYCPHCTGSSPPLLVRQRASLSMSNGVLDGMPPFKLPTVNPAPHPPSSTPHPSPQPPNPNPQTHPKPPTPTPRQ